MTTHHRDDGSQPDASAPVELAPEGWAPPRPGWSSPSRPRRRTPILRILVLAALVGATITVLDQRRDDDSNRLEVDEDGRTLPDFDAGVLRPLGPRDGKDSIQLPVTAEPSTGLHDGDQVAVSSPGFEPGERIGIVQCAKEAGGDTPEARGGVDGCDVGGVQYADADGEGVASGTISVRRVLTTPMTGTVDCAAEANRCLVAMGALSDYDRSGGHGIEFASGGAPVVLPTVTVTPSEGLADGDVVHLVAEGLTPGSYVSPNVCSTDPATCWTTGGWPPDPSDGSGASYGEDDASMGLRVGDDGRVEADIAVWRFLPGGPPGTYVDCAVSRCSLRLSGDTAPPTVPLQFTGGGSGPEAPALSVVPADGLAVGDQVVVRGKGFEAGAHVMVSMCAAPAGQAAEMGYLACGSTGGAELEAEDDGTFAMQLEIPELRTMGAYAEDCSGDGECSVTTACYEGCVGGPVGQDAPIGCDGVDTDCFITADVYQDQFGSTRPYFPPAPVRVTFR